MTVADVPQAAAVPWPDPDREQAFTKWWAETGPWIGNPSEAEDIAHEAFCAGGEAPAPPIAARPAAAERDRIRHLAIDYDAICWTDDSDDTPFADLLEDDHDRRQWKPGDRVRVFLPLPSGRRAYSWVSGTVRAV